MANKANNKTLTDNENKIIYPLTNADQVLVKGTVKTADGTKPTEPNKVFTLTEVVKGVFNSIKSLRDTDELKMDKGYITHTDEYGESYRTLFDKTGAAVWEEVEGVKKDISDINLSLDKKLDKTGDGSEVTVNLGDRADVNVTNYVPAQILDGTKLEDVATRINVIIANMATSRIGDYQSLNEEYDPRGVMANRAWRDGEGHIIHAKYAKKEDMNKVVFPAGNVRSLTALNELSNEQKTIGAMYTILEGFEEGTEDYFQVYYPITDENGNKVWQAGDPIYQKADDDFIYIGVPKGWAIADITENPEYAWCAEWQYVGGRVDLSEYAKQDTIDQILGTGEYAEKPLTVARATKAETADEAIADQNGKVIHTTYATKKEVNDIEIDTRNLLSESKEIKIVGDGTLSVRQIKLPFTVKGGDVFTFSCEDLLVGNNEPTSHKIALYYSGKGVLSNEPYISPDNKTATLTIKDGISPTDAYLNMYVGDYGTPAVATITYKGATLVKGNKPMLTWQAAPEDIQTDIDSKLPLSGGTLTGDLSGTNANFSGNVVAANLYDKTYIDTTYATKEEVDNLEISTRNLLRYNKDDGSSYWYSRNTCDITIDNDIIRGETNGSAFPCIFNSCTQEIDWQPNTNYVLSFYARGYGDYPALVAIEGRALKFLPYQSLGVYTGDWKKYTINFTTGNDLTDKTTQILTIYCGHISSNDTTSWLELKEVQIVQGDKATDWTPALEDEVAWRKIIGLNYRTTDDNDKISY